MAAVLQIQICHHPQQQKEIEIVSRTWPKITPTVKSISATQFQTLKTAEWYAKAMATMGKSARQFAMKVTSFTKNLSVSLQYTSAYLHVASIGRYESSFQTVHQRMNYRSMGGSVRQVGSREVQLRNV